MAHLSALDTGRNGDDTVGWSLSEHTNWALLVKRVVLREQL